MKDLKKQHLLYPETDIIYVVVMHIMMPVRSFLCIHHSWSAVVLTYVKPAFIYETHTFTHLLVIDALIFLLRSYIFRILMEIGSEYHWKFTTKKNAFWIHYILHKLCRKNSNNFPRKWSHGISLLFEFAYFRSEDPHQISFNIHTQSIQCKKANIQSIQMLVLAIKKLTQSPKIFNHSKPNRFASTKIIMHSQHWIFEHIHRLHKSFKFVIFITYISFSFF